MLVELKSMLLVNFELVGFVFSQEVAIIPSEYYPSVLLSRDAGENSFVESLLGQY